jgi:acyl carrier protein
MSTAETTTAQDRILETIQDLVKRRGGDAATVKPEASLMGDLEMDSLEIAELAGVLSDEFGSEPFSDGDFPETIAELAAFYKS